MKKILSVILTVLMMFSIGTTIVACKDDMDNDTSQTQELTDEQKICNAVTNKESLQFLGSIIGGNEIKSSRATITNLSWSGESKCTVSGVMQKTDIYGTGKIITTVLLPLLTVEKLGKLVLLSIKANIGQRTEFGSRQVQTAKDKTPRG